MTQFLLRVPVPGIFFSLLKLGCQPVNDRSYNPCCSRDIHHIKVLDSHKTPRSPAPPTPVCSNIQHPWFVSISVTQYLSRLTLEHFLVENKKDPTNEFKSAQCYTLTKDAKAGYDYLMTHSETAFSLSAH